MFAFQCLMVACNRKNSLLSHSFLDYGVVLLTADSCDIIFTHKGSKGNKRLDDLIETHEPYKLQFTQSYLLDV